MPFESRVRDDMTVLALSRGSIPCEFATRLAVDAGLTVIKVEADDGDPLRAEAGALFDYLAAGKRSVAVAGDALEPALRALATRCDAIVVDEWGYDVVRDLELGLPVVVVGERDATALRGISAGRCDEFLAFHASGLGYLTPRVMPGYPSADPLCPKAHFVQFLAGLYGVIALLALLGLETSDARTAVAHIGLAGATLPLLRREAAAVSYENARPHRGERIWKVSPAEVHRCRDGWLFVDVIEDEQWLRLCEFMRRPDLAADPRYATRDGRFASAVQLCAILDDFFADKPQSCWTEAQAMGVPIAPVNSTRNLVDDAQLRARGFFARAADGSATAVPRSPLARLFRSTEAPPASSTLGADTTALLETAA